MRGKDMSEQEEIKYFWKKAFVVTIMVIIVLIAIELISIPIDMLRIKLGI